MELKFLPKTNNKAKHISKNFQYELTKKIYYANYQLFPMLQKAYS